MKKKTKGSYIANKLERTTPIEFLSIIVLAFSSAIIPLIVLMDVIELKGILKDSWVGTDSVTDFFSSWKARLLILSLIALLFFWLYRIVTKRFQHIHVNMIPLGVYTIMVLLSTLFAEHKIIAFNGFVDRYEGFYVLMAYSILLLTSSVIVRSEKIAVPLLIIIFMSCTLIAILGLTQFFGMDFFQSDMGKKLILPKEYEHIADVLEFTFGDQRIMYTTVYNPNYLGSYSALLLPVSIGLLYAWIEKKQWKIALGFIFVGASSILFIGGMSRAGLLGGIVALCIFVVIFRKKMFKFWPYTLATIVLIAGIYIALDLQSNGAVTNEFANLLPTSKGLMGEDHINSEQKEGEPSNTVNSIEVKNNTLKFKTETEELNIKNDNGNLTFSDVEGNDLILVSDDGVYSFKDKRYIKYSITQMDNGFNLVWNEKVLPVIISDNNLYIKVKHGVAVNKLDKPDTFGFKGAESFASYRGYIWSRSIPMLKQTLILGHGPDTYSIYFPQNELVAKLNFLPNPLMIIDKPHNWYLQIGINTGVLSLIAMVVFLTWYLLKGLLLWIKDINGMEKSIGAAIFCGVIGYLIAGLFNDSNVSVAPVFWVILGMGIAFVYKYSALEKHNNTSR